MEDERESQVPAESAEVQEWDGSDELLSAVAAVLRSKDGRDSIARLVRAYADDLPRRSARAAKAMYWSYALAGITVVVVGVLGYLKVLGNETTGTLMGTVVAALFYRRNSN